MKINKNLLADLRELAADFYRSLQQYLRYLVDKEKGTLRLNKVFDDEAAMKMMDSIIADSEAGLMNEAERVHLQNLLACGVELHGKNPQSKLVASHAKHWLEKLDTKVFC